MVRLSTRAVQLAKCQTNQAPTADQKAAQHENGNPKRASLPLQALPLGSLIS
jgi:hypothetical protein